VWSFKLRGILVALLLIAGIGAFPLRSQAAEPPGQLEDAQLWVQTALQDLLKSLGVVDNAPPEYGAGPDPFGNTQESADSEYFPGPDPFGGKSDTRVPGYFPGADPFGRESHTPGYFGGADPFGNDGDPDDPDYFPGPDPFG
jgi:hypothetical protein